MSNSEHFTIKTKEEIGRYAVASSLLKPGELIFTETPFAFGPKSDSPPLCLGCLIPVDCTILCTRCSWPVCSIQCQENSSHLNNECQVFTKNCIKFQAMDDPSQPCLQYECITPLRVLLVKERNPTRWEKEVEMMENHNEIRKTKPIWKFNQTNIVDYLRGPCKQQQFSEDLIHKVCGILEVNAFEARTSSGYLIRCLYPKLAIFSHNCISNVYNSIAPETYQVNVRASLEIPEGDELFNSYTYSLWPTLVRRAFLKESKYFECKCERCKDKTELGSHLGTLKCTKCDNGIILSTDPLSFTTDWKCSHCEFKTSAQAVRKVYDTVQSEIDSLDYLTGAEGVQHREAIFRKYRSVFHPKNAYMTILRAVLTQMYGHVEGYTLDELPDVILERKVELCKELLQVLDVVEPGVTRIRGVTFYELHAPMIVLARNQYNSGIIAKEEFRRRMNEAIEVLGQSVEILLNEISTTPEGQLGLMAQQSYNTLKENLDVLIETA